MIVEVLNTPCVWLEDSELLGQLGRVTSLPVSGKLEVGKTYPYRKSEVFIMATRSTPYGSLEYLCRGPNKLGEISQ